MTARLRHLDRLRSVSRGYKLAVAHAELCAMRKRLISIARSTETIRDEINAVRPVWRYTDGSEMATGEPQ